LIHIASRTQKLTLLGEPLKGFRKIKMLNLIDGLSATADPRFDHLGTGASGSRLVDTKRASEQALNGRRLLQVLKGYWNWLMSSTGAVEDTSLTEDRQFEVPQLSPALRRPLGRFDGSGFKDA